MVRRRGMVGGLAKQLSYSAYQHMMAPPPPGQHLNIGWLGSPSVHWPPQAPRPPSLMSAMCNKMVGSLPRMPSLPQPELSSRRLSRLRRNLMQSPHPQVLPVYPQAPLMQTANILPMWCRSDEQMWQNPVKQRHRLPTSDISIQLKQQLQQLKRQQQLQQKRQQQQQQQQQQQPPQQQQQQQRELSSGFMPFNFGKCASSLIKFLDRSGSTSESSLYAATHPNPVPEAQHVPTISIVKRPYSVERHIHAADFDYVKLAKQMVTSKDKQFTGGGVGRTQVLPTHGEPHRLANRGSSKAPVSFTADYSASSTSLINHSAAQAGRQEELKAKSQSLQGETPAEMQLNFLAADIDANLQQIRKLLGTKLPHKRCGSTRTAKGLATLQRPEMCAKLKYPPLAGHAARHASLAIPQQSDTKLPQRVHQQHNSPVMSASLAALQQSELPQQLAAGPEGKAKVASLSEMQQSEPSDNVELPQQTELSGNVTPTTLPNLATDDADAKQEFKFTAEQLELMQKILQEKDQLQRAAEPEASMKAKTPKIDGHKRQINLNELFKDKNMQCVESDNSLWNSLMQLVAHMCDDRKRNEETERLKAGAILEPSKKEYSIYLMVTSDDEDDVGDSSRVGNQCNTPIATRKPRQARRKRSSTIKPLDIPAPYATLRQRKQQDQRRPLRKKRRPSLGHQNTEVFSCLSLPARRPLHWPNPRHIKCLAQGKKKRKRLPRRPCLRRQASHTLDSIYPSQLINPRKSNNRMSNPFLPQPRVPGNYTGFW